MNRDEWVRIGTHLMKVETEEIWVKDDLRQDFLPFQSTFYENPDLSVTVNSGFGTPFSSYHVDISPIQSGVSFQRADYRIEASKDYSEANLYVYDSLALKHALMNLYSAYIVHHQVGLLFHASCVVENGKAYLFTGNSGAGKSTAALLSHPRELLADEATIIRINGEEISAYDSPFRSEVPITNNNRYWRVGGIQSLNQSSANRKVELGKTESVMQLMDKIFYWPVCREDRIRAIQLLKEVVTQVPVYELYFKKDPTFWELIS